MLKRLSPHSIVNDLSETQLEEVCKIVNRYNDSLLYSRACAVAKKEILEEASISGHNWRVKANEIAGKMDEGR